MSSIRALIRTPGYSALAIATMALGLGATIALCAVVDPPLFRPLPFPAGDRLVVIQGVRPQTGVAVGRLPGPFYEAVLNHRGLEHVSFVRPTRLIALFDSGADVWLGAAISQQAASLIGLRPEVGRLFTPADYESTFDLPILISASTWDGRFGRDPAIIGRRIAFEGQVAHVIGVYPSQTLVPAFPQTLRPDFLIPEQLTQRQFADGPPAPIARMRAGVTFSAVQEEMRTQLGAIAERYPLLEALGGIKISRLRDYMYAGQRRIHVLLLWAAGVILLAVCLNAANLLLAHQRHKAQDLAVQRALGASRRRLVGDMLSQNLLLATTALPGALLVASLVCYFIQGAAPSAMAVHVIPSIDQRMVILGLALTTLLAVIMSAVALPQTLRLAEGEALRGTQNRGSRPHAWQRVLTGLQVCMVLALLIGATLMVNSVARLVRLPVGASVDNVLLFAPRLPFPGYSGAQAKQFWERLVEELEGHPDITSAAVGFSVPMMDVTPWATLMARTGNDVQEMGAMTPITRQYFDTLRIPFVAGRTFSVAEERSATAVGIVNEAAARAYWPNGDAIGRKIFTPWFAHPYTVIGVVADSRFKPQIASVPTMYVPIWTHKALPLNLLVRARNDSPALRAFVSEKVRLLEPDAVLPAATTYDDVIARWRERPLFIASVLGMFALLAIFVAATGTAAVVGYGVRLRYRELGIRLALGASGRAIRRLVLRDTLIASTLGIVAGLVVASLFAKLLQHELFEVSTLDPATYAASSLLLLVVVLGAGLLPAHTASRTDPTITLRSE